MKRKKILTVLIIPAALIIFLFFGFQLSQYNGTNLRFNGTRNDSSSKQHYTGGMMRSGRMGQGMMNRGMMGRGMMGRMMRRGMMNRGNSYYGGNQNGSWVAPPSANKLANPIQDIIEASRAGKNIFNAQCFTCHGTDGEGDGPAAASLNPKPANLTSSKVQSQSDGVIYWKITTGNSPMPSFKYGLSNQQRWELVDYIRTLAK